MTSTSSNLDIESFTAVHKALLPLDKESRQRVIDAVLTILGQQVTNPLPAAEVPPATPTTASATIPLNISPEEFVSSKKPKNTYQRLACLAYFLEHREAKAALFAKDLEMANQAARQVKISNLKVFLDGATRAHGFFTPIGKGKKQLTARGAAVVKALPDQEAVKKAMQDHPMPQKSGRRSKSAKKK